ncbi:MAG: hypothetical protein KAT28_01880 [Candidatus Aenigmarchaeota archaeon]|nr:hypothetical protein [Candidatus Aenigmarchaeota archaeon]
MKLAKLILITSLLFSIIFVSGCTNQTDITSIAEKIPQVQNFLETHPDADIKAVLWDKNFVETKIGLIREDCGEQMKIQDYYKVDLKTNSINLTLWLDTKDQTVLCAIRKGNNTSDETNTKTEVRKNCRELGGYLCSSEGQCALNYLNSTDSYCCPIECGVCPEDINCDDEDECTEDNCFVRDGKSTCEYRKIEPCPNNGICEEGEYFGMVTSCGGSSSSSSPLDDFESGDCPKTCDDSNENTADYYNYTTQRCEYKTCDGDGNNEESEKNGSLDYKFSSYDEYSRYIAEELEDLVGMDGLEEYGGREAKYGGSIYFMVFKHGDWDFVYYWAVEVDAESGELIKYKDITTDEGDRSGFSQIWWIPER